MISPTSSCNDRFYFGSVTRITYIPYVNGTYIPLSSKHVPVCCNKTISCYVAPFVDKVDDLWNMHALGLRDMDFSESNDTC